MYILLIALIFLAGATGCAFLWLVHQLAALQSSLLQLSDSVRVQNADLEPLAVAIEKLHGAVDSGEKFGSAKDLFHGRSAGGGGLFSDSWSGGSLLGSRRRFGLSDLNLKRGNSQYDDLYASDRDAYRGGKFGYNYDRPAYSRYDRYDRYDSYYDSYDPYEGYDDYDSYDSYDRYDRGRYDYDGLSSYSSRSYISPATRKGLQNEFKNKTRSLEAALERLHSLGDEFSDAQWQIPQVVHQTWKTDEVPAKYQRHMASWRRLHLHWKYEFWDDLRSRALIIEHFPDWIYEYDRMSGIKRADVARLAILYLYGGIYADIDVEATQCFDSLLVAALAAKAGVLLGEENFVHSVLLEKKSTWLVSNAVMASARRHPFWLEVLREIFQNRWCGDDPVQCTGPRLVDRVSWDYVRKTPACGAHRSSNGCVVRLPYAYFSPHIAEWNAENMLRECRERHRDSELGMGMYYKRTNTKLVKRACTSLERALKIPAALQTNRTYAVHHWQCSWCRKDAALSATISLSTVMLEFANGSCAQGCDSQHSQECLQCDGNASDSQSL